MSYPYPGAGGYPNQPAPATGFPTPGGYPAANAGYGQPPAPYPAGPGTGSGQPPYPATTAGGLPYPYAPQSAPDIGFGAAPTPYQPAPAASYPGQPPAQGGYPGQPPAQAGYPGQPPAQAGYPGQQPPAQAGYPGQPPAQAGYPGQPPAQAGYPGQPPAQAGYPGQQPPAQAGYPGQQPPAQAGYPGQQPPAQAGYPGQPPAQPGYGSQPPAQAGYPGAAATGAAGYGAAPPGRPGAPPVDAMRNMSIARAHGEGTVKAFSPFNAEHDAQVLRKAMKGMGTDEKAIIDVLCHRNNAQRQEIKKTFKTSYGKDLIKELKGELSGRFEDLVLGLLMTPPEFDAKCIRKALEGGGTDEGCLIEIMSTRTNAQINEIKAVYKTMFKRDLEKDLMSDTSGHFKRLLVSLVNAGRRETAPVDMAKARQDATELRQAGEKKLGTDESKFNQILCTNSHPQLQAIFTEYKTLSAKSIEQAIKSEMSGDLEQGMLAIVMVSQNLPGYFAERLHKSMKGAGTKDSTLIRVMVSRCEVDMVQIKQQFQAMYGKSVDNWIEGDTSGDYKRGLLALCGRR